MVWDLQKIYSNNVGADFGDLKRSPFPVTILPKCLADSLSTKYQNKPPNPFLFGSQSEKQINIEMLFLFQIAVELIHSCIKNLN